MVTGPVGPHARLIAQVAYILYFTLDDSTEIHSIYHRCGQGWTHDAARRQVRNLHTLCLGMNR